MRRGREFVNGHAFCHRGDDFVNEFAAARPNARATEDFAGLWIRQQFHETIFRFHDERFAVVVEGIARREKFYPARRRCFFRQADKRHLRFGEHDGKQQPMIYSARRFWLHDVVRRDFALRHGDVDDLVRPGAIARRENVRRAGLHFGIGDDAAIFRFHARIFQIQSRRVRNSAKREQNFLR